MQKISKRSFFAAVGYQPHKGQIQIHAAREKEGVRHVVAVCGTRFGKSWTAAYEMGFESIRPRARTPINKHGEFMGWIVAPTHEKANIVFDMVVRILRPFLKGHFDVLNKSDGIIEFTNLGGTRSRIMRRTTQDAAGKGKLVGHAVDFMVIDEAASIEDPEVWESQLSTRLLDRGGTSLHISSPRGVEGYFAGLYRGADQDPKVVALKMPTWLNPYIPRKDILYWKKTMPARRFAAEIGAELLADSGMVFLREDMEKLFVLPFEAPLPNGDYFGGLDLAMTNDHTVLTICRAPLKTDEVQVPRVVLVERFYKLPIDAQLSRIQATMEAYNECCINVDASGLGKPIVEQMFNRGMNIRPIVTTAEGKTSKRDQVMNCAALVERHGILLPAREIAPSLWDEMALYQWDETPSGKLTARAPDGAHDDCVASLLLATWWIRAAGTSTNAHVYNKSVAEAKALAKGPTKTERPEMVIRGAALPADAEDDEAQVYAQRQQARVTRKGSRSGGRLPRLNHRW